MRRTVLEPRPRAKAQKAAVAPRVHEEPAWRLGTGLTRGGPHSLALEGTLPRRGTRVRPGPTRQKGHGCASRAQVGGGAPGPYQSNPVGLLTGSAPFETGVCLADAPAGWRPRLDDGARQGLVAAAGFVQKPLPMAGTPVDPAPIPFLPLKRHGAPPTLLGKGQHALGLGSARAAVEGRRSGRFGVGRKCADRKRRRDRSGGRTNDTARQSGSSRSVWTVQADALLFPSLPP